MDKGFEIKLNDAQSHYLFHVMKAAAGDEILAFDNRSGEYLCSVSKISKKDAFLRVAEKTRPFEQVPDIMLLFAPVKKEQTDYIIQKATELGARALVPVITQRTVAGKVRLERFKSQAVEAAEQCRRVDLPEVFKPVPLKKLLSAWDKTRKLFYMDETGGGENIYKAFSAAAAEETTKAALLVGPEGGFGNDEFELLRQADFARSVSMGKRILRAETAAAAALACWQAIAGDWKKN